MNNLGVLSRSNFCKGMVAGLHNDCLTNIKRLKPLLRSNKLEPDSLSPQTSAREAEMRKLTATDMVDTQVVVETPSTLVPKTTTS